MKLKSLTVGLFLLIMPIALMAENIAIFFDLKIPQHEFAANDIKKALQLRNINVEFEDISQISDMYKGKKVVIALASDTRISSLLASQKISIAQNLGQQAYALRTTTTPDISYWVLGGDVNGAMYGALQIAENFNFDGIVGSYNTEESPYLKNRGIKFNIPLDAKSPTYFYDNDGTSHQEAIRHVWDMSFWTTWFDEMARHRYNVLSLWSPHPFTSMLNMEAEYPGIAIQGVTGYDESGKEVQINNMTIDDKVKFWQQVMEYGRSRGFDIYFCTWNIFLSTAEEKHGITHEFDNEITKTYLRKCTVKFLETYPNLTGFGVTVGERMGDIDNTQKEEWAWNTYGLGVSEYAQANPQRELVFIHRQHDGNMDHILKQFKPLDELPNVRFDLSFKYSEAHAHTTTTPARWYKREMEKGLSAYNIKSWLTVRNDDWYFLHWAEPQFVRDYVNKFPEVDKYVNGFYIGADGWVFTREFTSKDPYYENKDALCIQRTWYMQKLWGRISYNPSVSNDLFKKHLAFRYPEVPVEKLFEAWSNASGAIRLANEQVTGKWDLDMDWWPEGWTGDEWEGKGHFFSLKETAEATPFSGSKLCSFAETAKGECKEKTSAWSTIDTIDKMASQAITVLSTLKGGQNTELELTLKDLTAQANLGMYNAWKYKAVMFYEQNNKEKAREAIGKAYCYWKEYSNIMDELYIGVNLQRNVSFLNWHVYDDDALNDYKEIGGKGEPACTIEK